MNSDEAKEMVLMLLIFVLAMVGMIHQVVSK